PNVASRSRPPHATPTAPAAKASRSRSPPSTPGWLRLRLRDELGQIDRDGALHRRRRAMRSAAAAAEPIVVRVEEAALGGADAEREREPQLAEDADVGRLAGAVVDLPADRLEIDARVRDAPARAEAEPVHPDVVVGAAVRVDRVATDAVDVVPAVAAVAEQQ